MFWNKSDHKFIAKMQRNSMARHTQFFRRNLAINTKATNIRIIKIKTREELLPTVGGLNTLDENICYYIESFKGFSTLLFQSVVDVIATDSRHRIVGLFPNTLKDKIINIPKESRFIIIFKKGAIDFQGLKLNDLVDTKS
ncbi:MAG: hypothetical protein LBV37_01075 [Mycoplasmataceae bacterium]|jgi:hypothetical protein|nr:hypothetical protein [Mycoplasmataceae bacterium]